jgi:CDP-4-dehydro-6-deoxyglucose reductase, E1
MGYDHKYVYSHLGYNLKPLDCQAAIGKVQLKRLDQFTAARKKNWCRLREDLADLEEFFDFMLPTHAVGWSEDHFLWNGDGSRCDPSWFGFLMKVRENAPFTRTHFARALEHGKIGNRMLFGGNLTRQPAFVSLLQQTRRPWRIVGALSGADALMNDALFIGVYPGLTDPMLDYVVEFIHDYCRHPDNVPL